MGLDAILVLVVILFLLVSLYFDLLRPGFSFIIVVAVLGVFKVLTPKEILSGFANEQVAVVIMLLPIGEVFQKTSVLDSFFEIVFKKVKSQRGFTARLMFIVGPISAFVNNTPLVALMMPYIHNWSEKNKINASKLLIPLSYAAILGGCVTLIGTSTNLIVNGLVSEQKIIPDLKPLEIFDFASVGIPMVIIGGLYMVLFSNRLISSRKIIPEIEPNARYYTFELQLKKGSEVIGQTRGNAPFLRSKNFVLTDVYRDSELHNEVGPDFVFKENDVLLFIGTKEAVANLVNADKYRIIPSAGMFSRKQKSEIVEIVIPHKSSIIGNRLKIENFKRKYDATVIAIHRNGENLTGRISQIKLRAGDTLLLMVGDSFKELSTTTRDFYKISKIKEINPLGFFRTALLVLGPPVIVILNVLGILKLFTGLLVFLILILVFKIIKPKVIALSIDFELAFVIALSLALGTAMIKTGLAETIAHGVIGVFMPFGKIGLLLGIYFITTILAAYITSKAAVVIIFPISLSIAVQMGWNPLPFILVVSFAAAANFITPIGYQTNLMVYGSGGYKFIDYMRVGGPLALIYMIVTVLILNFLY